MNTVEAYQIIKEYLAQQERDEQLKRLQLKKKLGNIYSERIAKRSYCHGS